MEAKELVEEAFGYLNSYKRHRALVEIEGYDRKEFHELARYKNIDKLELALRAIKKELRESERETAVSKP